MDTFTLLISIILLWLLFQYNQAWLVFGIAILLVLSMRSWGAVILIAIALISLFLFQNSLNTVFPVVLLVIIALGFVLGVKNEPEQPQYYPPGLEGMGM